MPKETIHGEGFDVEIRWGNHAPSIQIATVMKPALTAEAPASLGALLDTWGREERYLAHGLFATLDERRQINDLIRVLRRARDAAFGRDA